MADLPKISRLWWLVVAE